MKKNTENTAVVTESVPSKELELEVRRVRRTIKTGVKAGFGDIKISSGWSL